MDLKVNTLVTHQDLSLGIGCVAKILSKTVNVNFGTKDTVKCNPKQLIKVDTSKCKTITFQEYRSRILKDKSTLNHAIVGNVLTEYVGIGWVTLRVVTIDDLKKYPRVIQ